VSYVDCIDCNAAIDGATAVLTADGPICDHCVIRRQRTTPLERDAAAREGQRMMAIGLLMVVFGLYLTTVHRYGQLVVLAGSVITVWGWRERARESLL